MQQKIYIPRTLNLQNILKRKSHFLFGARYTGKSTLIAVQLGDKQTILIDLLKSSTKRKLQATPEKLWEMLPKDKPSIIVIDEIQEVPELLHEVHRLIE